MSTRTGIDSLHNGVFPTEGDAALWELETRAAVVRRRGAASVTFAPYAADRLAGFIDDAPDRASFEAVLEHGLLPVLGEHPLLEVLESDRHELHRRLLDTGGDGDDGATRGCLQLIFEESATASRRSWVASLRGTTRYRSPTGRRVHPVA